MVFDVPMNAGSTSMGIGTVQQRIMPSIWLQAIRITGPPSGIFRHGQCQIVLPGLTRRSSLDSENTINRKHLRS